MKKVLVFGITDIPGGMESVIMNYYRNIDRNEIQFDFLCNTDIVAYEDEIKSLGGTIFRITARSKNYKQYKEDMDNFFKENANKYSAIWVNLCSLANIDYLKYAKKYGIPKRIIHCHNSQNMDSFLRGILHKWNKLFIKKYATDFWSCSGDASRWFYSNNIIKNNKYVVIKNAIDLKKYEYNPQIRDEYRKMLNIEKKFVIGHVGRFHFQKNHTFLIKIFNEVYKKNSNTVLLLVGEGEDKEKVLNLVKSLKLQDSVIFLGARSDVSNIMQAMDVFVLPSVFEGLGVVLIEAQAAGLPIFASKDVIPNEVKINKDNFEFVSLNNNETFWGNLILQTESKKINRKINLDDLSKSGYNIIEEKDKMEHFFKY